MLCGSQQRLLGTPAWQLSAEPQPRAVQPHTMEGPIVHLQAFVQVVK